MNEIVATIEVQCLGHVKKELEPNANARHREALESLTAGDKGCLKYKGSIERLHTRKNRKMIRANLLIVTRTDDHKRPYYR